MILETMRSKSRERPPSSLATSTKHRYDPLLWPERSKTGDIETCASRLSNVTFLSLPVGKCPLDDFPMSVDHGQVNRTMTDVRMLKRKDQNSLMKATQVSETLYRHSQRMFNHALTRAGDTVQIASLNPRKSHSQTFSGPTRAGSPIYNRRAQMMNAIRTRPVTVPAGAARFKHERGGKMLPIIKQTLARSNEDFRVQIIPKAPTSVCPSQWSSHPDVVLIPTVQLEEDNEQVADDNKDDDHEITDVVEDASKDAVPAKAKKRLGTRRGSDSRRRPTRHWVDDMTVSSVGSNHGQQEGAPRPAEQTAQGQEKKAVSQTSDKKVDKGMNGEAENGHFDNRVEARVGQNGEILDSAALSHADNLILTLQELQEKQLTLPEFKCPSSEEKSREYAIREWLKHTSFSIGNRNVPLL